MNLKETYNLIAADWFKDHHDDTWWVKGTDHFISLLKKGDAVLDVGCGCGVKSAYLHKKGLAVTGIDFSDKQIEISKKTVPGVDFEVLDMKEVLKLNRKFDGVFAQASLLHIPKNEIAKVIGDLASMLEPQGKLYIAVKEVRPGSKDEAVLEENDYGYSYQRFFSYYTMDELKGYLEQAGMEVAYANSEVVGKTTWLQVIGSNSNK